MNIRHYEAVFIINSVLSEQEIKGTVEKFKKEVSSLGGEIYHEENWGIKKLAYPIEHKTTGYYQLFEFKGNTDIVAKIELIMKRDESVMRFLTVSLDKHGLVFNQRRRKGEFNKKIKEEVEA